MLFFKKYIIRPNEKGYCFINSKFKKVFEPGHYHVFDLLNRSFCLNFSTVNKDIVIINQEILTKDNIALRLSFALSFSIEDHLKMLSKIPIHENVFIIEGLVEQKLHLFAQIAVRTAISQVTSEEINEKKDSLQILNDDLLKETLEMGIKIHSIQIKDITFPKNIQDLFLRNLEAKIRARSDLENAKTAVAPARALKNASELIKGDEDIRYMQYLETITKIAAKGHHTFVMGEIPKSKV